MIKIFKTISSLAIVGLTLISVESFAAGTNASGKVSKIHYMRNGVVLFRHDGVRSGTADCTSNGSPSFWAIDGASPERKFQIAGLITAQAQGKTIKVFGLGDCALWGSHETMDYFYIED